MLRLFRLLILVTGAVGIGHAQDSQVTVPPPSSIDFSSYQPQEDSWLGCKRYKFKFDNCNCWVTAPKTPLPGNHWAWWMIFPEAFADRTGEQSLLNHGYYVAYMDVGNTFGAPSALVHLSAFYQAITGKGLRPKPVLVGLSRGGVIAYNWAAQNPEKVSVIYGDAPLCSFSSRPTKGADQYRGIWASILTAYGFKNDEEAFASPTQPIKELAPIAQAHIPIIHVVGDADSTVPVAQNTALVEQEYQKLGGKITVIHKPGIEHHPHGLDDPTPLVNFILENDR